MKEQKTIKLTVLDVKLAAEFINIKNCPLATAIKRQFPGKFVRVGPDSAEIGSTNYRLNPFYLCKHYEQDILRLGDNDEEVLRTFKLT